MPEYTFELYNFARYPEQQHAALAAKAEDGWHIHTAALNFMECSVLWERDREPEKGKPASRPSGRRSRESRPAAQRSPGSL